MNMNRCNVYLGYIALVCAAVLALTSPAAAFDAPARIDRSLSLNAGCGLAAFVDNIGGGLASVRVRPLGTGATQTQAAGGASYFNGNRSTTFSAITAANLEANCGLADVASLVQQGAGASGTYSTHALIRLSFEATRTSDGDRYAYLAEISGAMGTTVTASQTLVNSAPTVTLGTPSGPDGSGNYTVIATLSENSSDFTAASLTLTNATATVSGGGSSYTIVLTPAATGAVSASVPKGAFTDNAGLGNWVASNEVAFSADLTAPTVSISSSSTTVAGAATVEITATFSKAVIGFAASDISVSNGSVTKLSGSGADYLATISTTGKGDIEVSIPAGSVTDAAGNANTASNTLSIANASVEETQKIIARFMQSRATQLVANQPDLTGFLSGSNTGALDLTTKRGRGGFDFASAPGAANDNDNNNHVWARLSGSWTEEGTSKTRYAFGVIGSHVKLSPNLLVGGMIEFDFLSQKDEAARIDGQGWLTGPYFVARSPVHPLFLEGRLLYGQTKNNISPFGTYSDRFETQRLLTQLKVTGEARLGRTTWMPSVQLSYTSDTQRAYTDGLGNHIPVQGVELIQAELGLDVRHQLRLPGNGGALELTGGLAYVGSSNRGSGHASLVVPEYADGHGKVKAGANYTLRNGAVLAVDVYNDGIGAAGYESYGVQFGFDLRF
ncbi:Ig-like domain-containing protein [Hoeflea sp.]|uniref:Ig-like domain-containing protein n=1 Tax=Hoeflea sp. TaxID=1940281 RepID=UPI003A8FED4F